MPLLEAMAAGLPIVAYASARIPETLGGAGLLLDDKTALAGGRGRRARRSATRLAAAGSPPRGRPSCARFARARSGRLARFVEAIA